MQQHGASNLDELYNSLTLQDIQFLDQLFEPCGKLESHVRMAQYVLGLGTTWLQHKYSGEELEAKQRENYRTISQLQ